MPSTAEDRAAYLAYLRACGGWVSTAELRAAFPQVSARRGWSDLRALVDAGRVQARPGTTPSRLWAGRFTADYRAAEEG